MTPATPLSRGAGFVSRAHVHLSPTKARPTQGQAGPDEGTAKDHVDEDPRAALTADKPLPHALSTGRSA